MNLQVDSVFLWVSDLEESSARHEALGFVAGPRHDRSGTFSDPDGTEIQLLER
ncbi:MAG TPA: hypothetical protein VJ858_04355 [Acidimicrobiia bacterium]|nr:hypothetical protein [Acidimicrobiia bacterium]